MYPSLGSTKSTKIIQKSEPRLKTKTQCQGLWWIIKSKMDSTKRNKAGLGTDEIIDN